MHVTLLKINVLKRKIGINTLEFHNLTANRFEAGQRVTYMNDMGSWDRDLRKDKDLRLNIDLTPPYTQRF